MGIEPGALSSEAPFLFLPCSVQPVELVVELGVGMEPRLLQNPLGWLEGPLELREGAFPGLATWP